MLTLRKSEERGFADHGWLKSHHTFSFAGYYDPEHMAFRKLRVINEDIIDGGTGFGKHPHRDMEIITYVVKGALEHQDSMGNKTIIRPGEVQKMSAASGVMHSEYNLEKDEQTHLFQIWIMPNTVGGTPGYGQKSFEQELSTNKLTLVVSSDARDGSIGIKQDADMYIARLKKDEDLKFDVRSGRGVWVQLIKGNIQINDQILNAGDAASTENEQSLKIKAHDDAEFILFDLA